MTAAVHEATPTAADARAAVERAFDMKRRAAGVVLAVAETHRGCIPAPLALAVDRYVEARDAHADAAALATDLARREVATVPGALAGVLERSGLNAMVAHHVVGLRLIVRDASPGLARAWRVEEPGGKRKPVPDYATDVGAIVGAERALDPDALDAYGMSLARETFADGRPFTARLAMASPYARARALLYAVGVDPDAPPAWVRDGTVPGGG